MNIGEAGAVTTVLTHLTQANTAEDYPEDASW